MELKSTTGKTKLQPHFSDPKLVFKHHQSTAKKLLRVTKDLTLLKNDLDKVLTNVGSSNSTQQLDQLNQNYKELIARISSVETNLRAVKTELVSSKKQPLLSIDKNLSEKVKLLESQLADKSSLLHQQGQQIQDLQRIVERLQLVSQKRGFTGSEVRGSTVRDGKMMGGMICLILN